MGDRLDRWMSHVKFQLGIAPLEEQCRLHINQQIEQMRRGQSYVPEVRDRTGHFMWEPIGTFEEKRLRGLVEPGLWRQTVEVVKQLRERCASTRSVCSERFLEEGPNGRVLHLSVAPSRGDDHMIRSFPRGCYHTFLRHERLAFRRIPGWGNRDVVHWMFLWDTGGLDVHLTYLWNTAEIYQREAEFIKITNLPSHRHIKEALEIETRGQFLGIIPGMILAMDFLDHPRFLCEFAQNVRDELKLLGLGPQGPSVRGDSP